MMAENRHEDAHPPPPPPTTGSTPAQQLHPSFADPTNTSDSSHQELPDFSVHDVPTHGFSTAVSHALAELKEAKNRYDSAKPSYEAEREVARLLEAVVDAALEPYRNVPPEMRPTLDLSTLFEQLGIEPVRRAEATLGSRCQTIEKTVCPLWLSFQLGAPNLMDSIQTLPSTSRSGVVGRGMEQGTQPLPEALQRTAAQAERRTPAVSYSCHTTH